MPKPIGGAAAPAPVDVPEFDPIEIIVDGESMLVDDLVVRGFPYFDENGEQQIAWFQYKD